jgi:hypothetical protein
MDIDMNSGTDMYKGMDIGIYIDIDMNRVTDAGRTWKWTTEWTWPRK